MCVLILASIDGWYHEDAPDILQQYLASQLGSEASNQASLWQAEEGRMSIGVIKTHIILVFEHSPSI
jgi:hypothetical protein